MLSELLDALRDAPEPLCAEALATSIDKDIDLVEAMLGELRAMGRIRLVVEADACAACKARILCGVRAPGGPGFVLVR